MSYINDPLLAKLRDALQCEIAEIYACLPTRINCKSRLGKRVLAARLRLNLTRTELAARLGCPVETIKRYEIGCGECVESVALKAKFAEVLGISKIKSKKNGAGTKRSSCSQGATLKRARKAKKLTQKQLAEKAGVTRAAVSLMEIGADYNYGNNNHALKSVCEVLEVDVSSLEVKARRIVLPAGVVK